MNLIVAGLRATTLQLVLHEGVAAELTCTRISSTASAFVWMEIGSVSVITISCILLCTIQLAGFCMQCVNGRQAAVWAGTYHQTDPSIEQSNEYRHDTQVIWESHTQPCQM